MDTIERIRIRTNLMGDPSLSPDFPLSWLLARGHIDREMHDAGMSFASVYIRVFGTPNASRVAWAQYYRAPDLDPVSRPIPSQARDFRAEAEYAHALACLDALDDRHLCRKLVHGLAVYLDFDWWMRDIMKRVPFADRHRRRRDALKRALTALANLDPVRIADIDSNPLGIRHKHEPIPRVAIAGVA